MQVGHGRVIQSVGTPYGGTPIARFASLGKLFRPFINCDRIEDLTVEGAERWRRMIPEEFQREVFFYTTQVGSCSPMFATAPCYYQEISL